MYDIKSFDPVLGKTLIEFQALVKRRKYMQSIRANSAVNLDMCFRDTKTEDLHLDFTLPVYPDIILGFGADKEMVASIIDLFTHDELFSGNIGKSSL
ncbi:hypothetical protein Tco_0784258 [Tanacetum coccineum]